MYTLILRNNASNEVEVISGLTNVSEKRLYLQFDADIDAPDGEYTYAAYPCDRNDVNYDFRANLLDSILSVDDLEFQLRDLNPRYGIIRIGDITPTAQYDNDDNQTYYYE